MKALLYPTIHGLLIIDEKDALFKIFWKNKPLPFLAAQYLNFISGNLSEEFKIVVNESDELKITEFFVENPNLSLILNNYGKTKGISTDNYERLRKIQNNLIQYWMDGKVQFSAQNINIKTKTLSEIMIKAQISETATQKDAQVKQASDTIVDIDKSINFFITRLREWYGLHFPELTDKLIPDNHQFSEFVAKIGPRPEITVEKIIQTMHFQDAKANLIFEKANRSMGGKLDDLDISSIRTLAQRILDFYDYRLHLENYIENSLQTFAPNLKRVLGPSITAKLISIAGSLEKLAMIPSSTVQMLGAEKALFKALRSSGKTPKYGIIFQWSKIRREKSYLRGKIARMAAGKISILAKVDYYEGKFIGDMINDQIDKKIELLRKQFPKPPKKKFVPRESKPYQKSRGKPSRKSYQSHSRDKPYQKNRGKYPRKDKRKGAQEKKW